ncbi:MAG TPA: winged helix-turn-helix domain-containing protein [Thermoplasmata archaeon]|nr:winged helix-turn-helix domain-containing protein [Thermoplasmata archaeon]
MAALPGRPDLFVVARILERLWREGEPMLKTHLQVASNVNYDVFRRYLGWMAERGLVAMEDSSRGHERVSLTAKGHEAYRRLVEWIREFAAGPVTRGEP